MRRLIMAIVYLMTMVVSANAQERYHTRGYSRYFGTNDTITTRRTTNSYANNKSFDYYKEKSDDMYYKPAHKDNGSFFSDKQQMFALNVTLGEIYSGEKSHLYYGVDFVICGFLMSLTLSDTSEGDDYNLSKGFQFGYFFPVLKLDKDLDYRNGWSKALLVAPIIEFSQVVNIDGHHLHENVPGHLCHYFVDTSYTTAGKTGFGVGVMYRGGCGNIMCKITTTSVGVSFGIGM